MADNFVPSEHFTLGRDTAGKPLSLQWEFELVRGMPVRGDLPLDKVQVLTDAWPGLLTRITDAVARLKQEEASRLQERLTALQNG